MPEDSCWGCGKDYLHFWSEDDLLEVEVDGEKVKLCPDCHEEMQLQNMIVEE